MSELPEGSIVAQTLAPLADLPEQVQELVDAIADSL